jgi:hypothetical protein
MVILRKGGIHEETKDFQVQSKRFLLFPTYEHQKKSLIAEKYHSMLDETIQEWRVSPQTVMLQYAAEVVAERLVYDEHQLAEVACYHIGTPLFALERLHWKKQQPLHVLLLRVYKRSVGINLTLKPEHSGCKSWLQLDELSMLQYDGTPFDTALWSPVVDDKSFHDIFLQFTKQEG